MPLDKNVGFLGAGNMAGALIGGLLASGVSQPRQLWVTNRSRSDRLRQLSEQFGIQVAGSKAEICERSDVLIVACKPKDVAGLLAETAGHVRSGQVVLSLAAGVTTESYLQRLPQGVQVVRAMPNTSSLIRESATAIAAAPGTGPDAVQDCRTILEAVGKVVEVAEPLLDAVTGLSGTGPAYIYKMVEAMVDAGVLIGLDRPIAFQLVLQTVLGAARMLVETGADPTTLRQQVTSPGGTTAVAMQVLGERGFEQAVVQAIVRATQRSQELGAVLRQEK